MKYFFYLLVFLILISCNKDNKTIKVTNFTKSQFITLKPYKFGFHTFINIEAKGYTNDSVLINQSYYPNYKILLKGKIDTLIQMEYYGESSVDFIFDPYKASEGNLEIKFQL